LTKVLAKKKTGGVNLRFSNQVQGGTPPELWSRI